MEVKSPVLTLDVGNTSVKFALITNHEVSHYQRVDRDQLLTLIKNEPYSTASHCAIMGSGTIDKAWLTAMPVEPFVLKPSLEIPIKSSYTTPLTLGLDRKCNAVAAAQLGSNVLVIDMGTCVTYDLVHAGEYKGGAISPGWTMRLKAMHEFTANLPLLTPKAEVGPVGLDTRASMLLGAQMGLIGEIQHFISIYEHNFPGLKTVLTGGDASDFVSLLNCPIFADPYLTLKGLYEIFLFHLR